MEPYNKDIVNPNRTERPKDHNRSGRVFAGLIVVIVGVVILSKQVGVHYPHWLFSFKTFLIALGLFLGFRHGFRGFWFIPVVIGSVLLIDDFVPGLDASTFIWPSIIILVGLLMIFKPFKKGRKWREWEEADRNSTLSEDLIDSVVIFGSVKKNVISKTFRGGETVTIFGGTEINLSQADVSGKIVIDMVQIFGGTKLLVPPHWKVETEEVVSIFGGVEDKRPLISDTSKVDESKVLRLKGTCIFGGIDIKSY